MKKAYVLFLGLLPLFSQSLVSSAATNDLLPLRAYPWSESSEYVRLGKDLLDRIAVRSVAITNFDAMLFVLTPEFVAAFLLTLDEVERMSTALTNALHEYRTVQGNHFEPLDDDATFEKARSEVPSASGSLRFSLKPFEAEAAAIRQKLKSEVFETLGPERTKLFWLQGLMFLDGEMNTTNHAIFAGQTHSFHLLTGDPGPLVDVTVTYKGGSHGRPYGEALDQYAPGKLKPILKRWRDSIAERPRGSFAWTAPASEQTVIDTPPSRKPPKWSDVSEYIDLPKAVVRALKVPGLTDEEEISSEAIALLGLTTNEVNAVTQLYREMKARFEQLERANFVRPDPKQTSFILRAFPEQTAALKQEWHTNLKDLIGASRAELLDQFVRTPVSIFMLRVRGRIERELRGGMDAGPRWFDRGLFEMRIDVQTIVGANGREIREIRYKSDRPEGGSIGGPRLNIPNRFRHLLTPEMLDVLGAL